MLIFKGSNLTPTLLKAIFLIKFKLLGLYSAFKKLSNTPKLFVVKISLKSKPYFRNYSCSKSENFVGPKKENFSYFPFKNVRGTLCSPVNKTFLMPNTFSYIVIQVKKIFPGGAGFGFPALD